MRDVIEVEEGKLPRIVTLKGVRGNHVQFLLKSAGRKLGLQLIKLDPKMLQLLEQN